MLQFFLILSFFVLPPIFAFQDKNAALDFSKFNFYILPCFLLGLFLFLQNKNKEKSPLKRHPVWSAAFFSSHFFIALGCLALSSAFFEGIRALLKIKCDDNVILPSNGLEAFFCALTLAASAFYEESLYRLYLPNVLKSLFLGAAEEEKRPKLFMALKALMEFMAAALFALAHRPQGIFAVLNAFAAGCVLRVRFVKSKSLWPPFAAHLCYNACALLFAFL